MVISHNGGLVDVSGVGDGFAETVASERHCCEATKSDWTKEKEDKEQGYSSTEDLQRERWPGLNNGGSLAVSRMNRKPEEAVFVILTAEDHTFCVTFSFFHPPPSQANTKAGEAFVYACIMQVLGICHAPGDPSSR